MSAALLTIKNLVSFYYHIFDPFLTEEQRYLRVSIHKRNQ